MSKSERILVKPKSKSRKILLPAKSRFQFLYFRRGISPFLSYMPKYICSCFIISMLFLLGKIYLPYFILNENADFYRRPIKCPILYVSIEFQEKILYKFSKLT